MIHAHIPIQHTPEGIWKAGPCSIRIDSNRPIPLSHVSPEETLDDLVEAIMGQALLSLDKNGRRGTSEPIQWEITVDGVPYCYRCVDPMQKLPAETAAIIETAQWKCLQCGAVIHFNL